MKARQELSRIQGDAEVAAFTNELKKRATIIIPEQQSD
jgi:hypothetical protein